MTFWLNILFSNIFLFLVITKIVNFIFIEYLIPPPFNLQKIQVKPHDEFKLHEKGIKIQEKGEHLHL